MLWTRQISPPEICTLCHQTDRIPSSSIVCGAIILVALDKQFFHHRGTKPQSRGRWRDESWLAGKSPCRRTADILSARRHRDTSISSNASCENEIIYCGYRFDPESQLYYVRNRTYNPVLGRWIQRDPIGYAGGVAFYEYSFDRPIFGLNPSGLQGAIPISSPGMGLPPVTLPQGIPTIGELMGWLGELAAANPELAAAIGVIAAIGAYVIWRMNVCWPGYEQCVLRAHTRSNWCTVVYRPNQGLGRVDELKCVALHESRFQAECMEQLVKCLLAFWSGYFQPRMPCQPCARFCLPSVG